MNRLFPSLVILLLASVFCSCSQKITPEPPPTPPGGGDHITLGQTNVVLSGPSAEGIFSLTAAQSWSVELSDGTATAPDWFSVSETSGPAGEHSVKVYTTRENPYTEDRNAFVRIKTLEQVALLTVTQKKPDAIAASKDQIGLGTGATDFQIEIQLGQNPEIIIPEQYGHWLTRQSGSGSAERFRAMANTSGHSRRGEVILRDGERADTIRVYQKASDDTFLLEDIVYHPWRPGTGGINIQAGIEFDLTIGENPDRFISAVSRTAPGRAPRVDRAYFSVNFNIEKQHKTGTIALTNSLTKDTETLTVIQRAETELVYFPEGEYLAVADGETFTARVSRDYEYTATVPQMYADWLSVGSKQDNGFEQPWSLPITLRPNETNFVRTGYVLLEDADKTVTDTIFIRQLCNPDDRGILTALYESTGGPRWSDNTGWLTNQPLSEWYGITTDPEGRVTAIELPNNNLSGTVPDYSLDLLERLVKLDLSHNRLTYVTGQIGSLTDLRYLDLSDNLLSGALSDEFMPLLVTTINNQVFVRYMDYFCFNDNDLGGGISVFLSQAIFMHTGNHYFDLVKQRSEGFYQPFNLNMYISLPDVGYTDTEGQPVGLKTFCAGNTYTILFRSTEINDEVIAYLQRLNTLSRASIPGYRIGVAWDAVDTGFSVAKLEQIQQTYCPDITILAQTTDNARERFKFGDKAEFYLADHNGKIIRFNYGLDFIHNFLLPPDLYFSQDYSKDKTYRTVQTATVGAGVDIVFMGDGFTDRDIENGSYDLYAEAAFEALFDIEPFKSLRPRFNLYVVYAVSRNSDYDHPSAYTLFGVVPNTSSGDVDLKQYGYDIWPEYGAVAPVRDINQTTIMMAVNYKRAGGVALPYSSAGGVSFTTTGVDLQQFKNTMVHEMGHAYAGLVDEYVKYQFSPTDYVKETSILFWTLYGTDANLDFTDDLSEIKWKQFIGHPKYPYVGAFEGCTNRTGAWRSEQLSVMGGSNYLYFNAPSREAIYKRTMLLGGETYSFDEFVAQDHVTPPPIPTNSAASFARPAHLTPPIRRPER